MPPRKEKMRRSDDYICKYFAHRYSSHRCLFEDLYQEGMLAILKCKKENHRWLSVRQACQKAHYHAHKTPLASASNVSHQQYDPRTEASAPVEAAEDPALKALEDKELLGAIIDRANLTDGELAVVTIVKLEGLNMRQAEEVLGITNQTIHEKLTRAMDKLQFAVRGREDEL